MLLLANGVQSDAYSEISAARQTRSFENSTGGSAPRLVQKREHRGRSEGLQDQRLINKHQLQPLQHSENQKASTVQWFISNSHSRHVRRENYSTKLARV